MNSSDAILLTAKLTQLKKTVNAIAVKDNTPSALSMKSNSIFLINGLLKDVSKIYTKCKKNNNNNTKVEGIYKTGYPCKPIKRRKNENSTIIRDNESD